MPSRNDVLLTHLTPATCLGLEIGPLDKPVVRRSDGKVVYVDHLSCAQLQAHYQNDPNVDTDAICVDAVLADKRLPELFGAQMKFDYVVASHVVEHVPDLVGWLAQVHQVLAPGGELRLAVPDRRFSFDYLRDCSALADVLAAQVAEAQVPQPRAVLDYYLHLTQLDLVAAWRGQIDPARLPRPHAHEALQLARRVVQTGEYLEIHVWVFTPASFAQLMIDLADQHLNPFCCTFFADTASFSLEFFVGLAPCENKAAVIESWRQMRDHTHQHDPEYHSDAQRSLRLMMQKLHGQQQRRRRDGAAAASTF